MNVKTLTEEVLKLPVKSRIALLEAGLASIVSTGQEHILEEWAEEGERRLQALRLGDVQSRPAEDVLKDIFGQ
jgi:hypothetical protein